MIIDSLQILRELGSFRLSLVRYPDETIETWSIKKAERRVDDRGRQSRYLRRTYHEMYSIRQVVKVGFASFHQGWGHLNEASLAKFAVLEISRVEGHGSIDTHVLDLRRYSAKWIWFKIGK